MMPMPELLPPWLCQHCRYDKSHTDWFGRCPECGLDLNEAMRKGRQPLGDVWEGPLIVGFTVAAGLIVMGVVYFALVHL